MTTKFSPGLVHAPVTPFKRDQGIDYDTYAKILEFHLRNGAEALALPMPEGEDMSLKDAEQRELLSFALARVKGRMRARHRCLRAEQAYLGWIIWDFR